MTISGRVGGTRLRAPVATGQNSTPGVRANLSYARRHAETKCDAYHEQGECRSRRNKLHRNRRGATHEQAERAEQACTGGSMPGCPNLGTLYEDGNGLTKDTAKAAAYQQACTNGEMAGCASLGLLHEDGNGVTKDAAKAATLHQQAWHRWPHEGVFQSWDFVFERQRRYPGCRQRPRALSASLYESRNGSVLQPWDCVCERHRRYQGLGKSCRALSASLYGWPHEGLPSLGLCMTMASALRRTPPKQ